MSTADLTRTTAQAGLSLAMDARGANLEQTALIFNPSVEIDSLGELPAVLLRHGAPEALVAQMVTLCRRVLESNVAEGNCEMGLAGLLEDHVDRARTLPLELRSTAKQIAARLRGPLAVLLQPGGDGIEWCKASWTVRDELAATPREQLLAPAVRHELRDRKFRKLTELADAYESRLT
jgi:hypothetical protein